jgi:heme ABC exporter ATP-binding subunit CcmA
MSEPLVDLSNITVRVHTTPILTGVTMHVAPGEVVGVAGPNGAGKTTLLSVVSTLTAPSSGMGRVLGADLGTPEVRRIRGGIGWSGHEPGLYPDLTLAENLRFVASLLGLDEGDADRALEQVGLAGAARRLAGHASNGMRRRVDLARLLMTAPRLVLLDEANTGLDEAAEAIIDEVLRRVKTAGGGALLVSHDAAGLAARTHRVLRIEAGTVRE